MMGANSNVPYQPPPLRRAVFLHAVACIRFFIQPMNERCVLNVKFSTHR